MTDKQILARAVADLYRATAVQLGSRDAIEACRRASKDAIRRAQEEVDRPYDVNSEADETEAR